MQQFGSEKPVVDFAEKTESLIGEAIQPCQGGLCT